MLVPKLALDSQPERGTMGNRQIVAVHRIRHDRLWVESIIEVDTFVIAPIAVESFFVIVCAVEHDEARIRFQTGRLEEKSEWNSGPFADRAPTLNTVVPSNLRSGRQLLEIGQREAQGLTNLSIDC